MLQGRRSYWLHLPLVFNAHAILLKTAFTSPFLSLCALLLSSCRMENPMLLNDVIKWYGRWVCECTRIRQCSEFIYSLCLPVIVEKKSDSGLIWRSAVIRADMRPSHAPLLTLLTLHSSLTPLPLTIHSPPLAPPLNWAVLSVNGRASSSFTIIIIGTYYRYSIYLYRSQVRTL